MNPEHDNRPNWQTAIVLVIAACLIAALTFYFTKKTYDVTNRVLNWPGRIAEKLGKLFQSKVSITNTSFTLDQKDIAELAVVQRRIVCTTKYDGTWLGSEATVIIQGAYTVKAGYDLNGCHLSFDEHGKSVSVQLPEPQILSITTDSQKVFFASQGIIKKIPPKEMETVFAQNLEQARREANDLGVLADAKAHISDRLNDLLGDDVRQINISSPKP